MIKKFFEKILYGFGFGSGMGISFYILNVEKKQFKYKKKST